MSIRTFMHKLTLRIRSSRRCSAKKGDYAKLPSQLPACLNPDSSPPSEWPLDPYLTGFVA